MLQSRMNHFSLFPYILQDLHSHRYLQRHILVQAACRSVLSESDQSENLRTCDYRDLSEPVGSSLQMHLTLLPFPFLKVQNSSFLVFVDQEFWKRFWLRVFHVLVVKGWLWLEQVTDQYLLFKQSQFLHVGQFRLPWCVVSPSLTRIASTTVWGPSVLAA